MLKYSEKRKDQALSSLMIYWLHPEAHKGYKYLRRYSLDKKADRQHFNAEPQRKFFRDHFIKPNFENIKVALIYDRRTNLCVEAYGYAGEVLDPEDFNQKY